MNSVNTEKTYHHSSHWGAFDAIVEDGKLTKVRPFKNDPCPSPILNSIPNSIYGKTRVSSPMVRSGWLEKGPQKSKADRGKEKFIPVSWETATDLIADELKRVKKEHGNESIFAGSYGWASAGKFHNAKGLLKRFFNLFGGFTDQKFTYSISAGYAITPYLVGTNSVCSSQTTSWDSVVENTELMVLFGGIPVKNNQVMNGGIAEHSTEEWLKKAKDKGVEFINISPLRSDIPKFTNAKWLQIRPNSDTALMLGLAHTLVIGNLHSKSFLKRNCIGYDKFEPYLLGTNDGQPKDAKWASVITEIPEEEILLLAKKMASSRTMIATNWSLQRAEFGEQPFSMTITLASILGQIGLPGGGFAFGYGSMGGIGIQNENFPTPKLPTGDNPINSYIPVARIADLFLNPGKSYDFDGEKRTYPITKIIYWCGGNPFHHHQDLNRLIEAWKKPDTVIVHDPWWTSTAKHADIILPATTTLERNDIGSGSKDTYIIAMQKAIEPVGTAKSDYEIFSLLSNKLGFEEDYTEGRDETQWIKYLYNECKEDAGENGFSYPSFDTFWNNGHIKIETPNKPFVLFENFRNDPEQFPLNTPSKKIEIFSKTLESFNYEDCPPHSKWIEPSEWLGSDIAKQFPLHLISNQPKNRLHGQMDHGSCSLSTKIKGREPAVIHPKEASRRGIEDGDVIKIFNERGSILAGASLSEDIREGVIQIYTGAWFDPVEPGVPGSLDKHGNPNVLTLDKGTSSLSQGPSSHSTLVEVSKFTEKLPEVTAFQTPEIMET
ncbi:MAG: molybdopterin guanine dinucleotide-containing S/N-oxide reductase [Nitrospinota bacterium]|nr:molybdopterin guanine dinucleotide-containing S/N-oxide reductase [Nitrospinota bacterium]